MADPTTRRYLYINPGESQPTEETIIDTSQQERLVLAAEQRPFWESELSMTTEADPWDVTGVDERDERNVVTESYVPRSGIAREGELTVVNPEIQTLDERIERIEEKCRSMTMPIGWTDYMDSYEVVRHLEKAAELLENIGMRVREKRNARVQRRRSRMTTSGIAPYNSNTG